MFGLKPGAERVNPEELSTPRGVRGWIGSLPRENVGAAAEQIASMLQVYNDANLSCSRERLQALLTLDQDTQPILSEYRLLCLLQPGNSADLGKWDSLKAAYKQLGRAFQRYISAYLDAPGGTIDRETVAVVTQRSLLAAGNRAKVGYFYQNPLEAKYWKIIHKLYRFAEAAGFATEPTAGSSSSLDAYMRILMLATASTGGLSAKQIEIADDWLGTWCRGLRLDAEYHPRHHLYYVNLGRDSGPHRIYDVEHDRLCRYISVEALSLQVERTRAGFREGDAVTELGINANFRSIEFMETMERLQRAWTNPAAEGDQRGQPRVAAEGRSLDIVRSLANLCQVAKREFESTRAPEEGANLSAAEELDLKVYGFVTERTRERKKSLASTQEIALHVEQWPLQDESLTGYGAKLAGEADAGLRIGTLVGVRQSGTRRWGVGSVTRKISRREQNVILVGIEMMSQNPVIVTLKPPEQDLSMTSSMNVPLAREAQWALFLPGDRASGRADSLLIDVSAYSPGRKYILGARNVSYFVTLNRVIRKGDGWARVGFDVLSKR